MSRCFPYPPPGYCRNGATAHEALIESIKLQKETDKAKAERRKEKRAKKEKEKKKEEKEKRKNDEKSKSHKNHESQDPHKLLPKEPGFTEAQLKGTKPNAEALEKSDLTQEHGQPIKPCYSSDSTQNSNKRRRDEDNDDCLLPDDSSSHGKQIKVRLLKKHKGSDSSNSVEDTRSKTVPSVPSPNLDRTLLVSSTQNNGVPATSGRENNAVQGIPLTQTKSNTRIERTTQRNQNRIIHPVGAQSISGSAAKPTLPSGSRKGDVEVLNCSRQQQKQQIASFVRYQDHLLFQSQLKHEIPRSSVVSRNVSVQPQGLNSGRQQQGPSTLKPGIPGPLPSPITTGKKSISEITNPSSSGPVKLQKRKEEPKKVGPTRAEKKMMKKQGKYEKLIGSWVPPVFQAILPEVGGEDEDWLSRRMKPANSSISRGEVETCREVPSTL